MRIKEVDIIDKDDFKNEDGHKNEVNLRHEELIKKISRPNNSSHNNLGINNL